MESALAQGDTCVGRLILTTSYFDPSPLDWAAARALGRRSRRTSQEPSDETTGTFFYLPTLTRLPPPPSKKGAGWLAVWAHKVITF